MFGFKVLCYQIKLNRNIFSYLYINFQTNNSFGVRFFLFTSFMSARKAIVSVVTIRRSNSVCVLIFFFGFENYRTSTTQHEPIITWFCFFFMSWNSSCLYFYFRKKKQRFYSHFSSTLYFFLSKKKIIYVISLDLRLFNTHTHGIFVGRFFPVYLFATFFLFCSLSFSFF